MSFESLDNKNGREIRLPLRLKRTVEEFIRAMLKYAVKQVMVMTHFAAYFTIALIDRGYLGIQSAVLLRLIKM